MACIIAIANQKGGVGKSTTTANLGAGLKERGRRVLMVDMDPQATLTKRYGNVDQQAIEERRQTIYYGLVKDDDGRTRPFAELILGDNPALIPSNIRLSTGNNEILVGDYLVKHNLLKKGLATVRERFDYILIDCPPRVDLLTVNALCAAQGVLIPSIVDYDSLLGMEDLMKLIRDIKTEVNHDLEVLGVLPTLFHKAHRADQHYLEQLYALLRGFHIFEPIAYSTRYKQGTETGLATLENDPQAPGVEEYRLVVDYLIQHYE